MFKFNDEVIVKEELYETPLEIESLDWFELNDPELNTIEYNKRISKVYERKKEILRLTEDAIIYQYKSEFFCLDSSIKRITYYLSYEVSKNRILGEFVWQSLVWRYNKLYSEYLKDVPTNIFWNYLQKKYNTIITDSEQTWNGRSFWELRIAEALNKNLNVYFYNFENNHIEQIFDYDELRIFQQKYDIWGNSEKHKKKRMVITSKDLMR